MRCLIIILVALCALTGVTYGNSVQEKSWMQKLLMTITDKNNRHKRSPTDDIDEYGPIGPNEICKENYHETTKSDSNHNLQKYCKKCEEGLVNPDPRKLHKCIEIGSYVIPQPKNRVSSESMAPTPVTTIATPTTPQTSATTTTKKTTTMKPTTMKTTTTSDPTTTSALTTKNNYWKMISNPRQFGIPIYKIIVCVVFFILAGIFGIMWLCQCVKSRRIRLPRF